MSTEGIALVSYILFLISGITALAVGSIAFFYSLEVNKNMKEGRRWGAIMPFAVFMPSFFLVLRALCIKLTHGKESLPDEIQ
ncbi:hypothetical protein [Microbulbifer sp. JMSA008]|uniref:hypothetical protein n=1 Tax=Microbulbifer sp. JMSA008 TaxID=3243373 RepID=UPI00403975B0